MGTPYTAKQMSEFLRVINTVLGTGKYKVKDMTADFAKTVIIAMQLQGQLETLNQFSTQAVKEYRAAINDKAEMIEALAGEVELLQQQLADAKGAE